MNIAPIILFTYSRPTLTLSTLQALKNNELADESTLYIYSDGPKENASPKDLKNIEKVRKVIRQKQWCKEVKIIERIKNYGLRKNIILGVSEIVKKHGKVIVLEDDLNTSPYFLKFMNDGLATYEANDKVLSIGACNFFSLPKNIEDSFFFRVPDCLGWATWSNRWELFEKDSKKLFKQLENENLLHEFNLQGNYPFTKMLKKQMKEQVSSWAINWYAVSILHNKLNLYPKYALTNHMGLGHNATNSSDVDYSEQLELATRPLKVQEQPVQEIASILHKIFSAHKINYYKGIKGFFRFYFHRISGVFRN